MACKSMINTRLSTATAVAAGGTIPLGSAVHGFGSNIVLNGNAVTIKGASAKAYYRIVAHATVEPTAAGSVAVQVLDGTTVLDFASGIVATAGDPVDMTVLAVVYVSCACLGNHTISFTIDSAASVTDFAVEVEQI